MIYTSTSCLKNPRNILTVLNEYERAEIENVELGSVHSYFDIKKLKEYNFNFMIHGYFPPPKTPFNSNLASTNLEILNKSKSLAKKAIDIGSELNASFFTFHAGITIDPPKLGIKFPQTDSIDRKRSIEIFLESVREILDYSYSRDVKLAMELNVVQKFNLINGENLFGLFADYEEVELFYEHFKSNEIGILLDLGHTIVTSRWLNFDKDEFVQKLEKKVSVVHISNNNGLQDQNHALTDDCWVVSKLKPFKNKQITLESMNLTIDEIKQNIKIIKKNL